MRAAFGLIGILAFLIAIVLFWNFAYLPYTQQVVRSGQSAQSTAAQIAGVDLDVGGRVTEHVKLDPVMSGSQIRGLRVVSVTTGSAFEKFYGVRAGDVIDRIGPQTVRDIGDAEMAKSLAIEAYQRQWELRILRNNRTFVLPQESQAAAAAAGIFPAPVAPAQPMAQPTPQPGVVAAPPPQQPAPPQNPNQQPANNQNSLSRQLDAITNYGQKDNP